MTIEYYTDMYSDRKRGQGPLEGSRRQGWLRRTAVLTLALAGLTGCAGLISPRSPTTTYELMDKAGPTGLRVAGFMPGCTSSCFDEVVRTELSVVSAAPVIAMGPNQPAPRRWFVINVDYRIMPRPVVQLTARMIGPGESRRTSSTSAPTYESAPPVVFKRSVAEFASRFFG